MMTSQSPLFGAMHHRQEEPPSRGHGARRLGFLLAMQAFHLYPLSDLVHRHYPVTLLVPILLLETVFAALWLYVDWLALATTREFAAIRPWLIAMLVLGIGLAAVLGGQYKGLLIYASIACAVALPLRATLPAITVMALIEALVSLHNRQYLGTPPGGAFAEFATGVCLAFFLGLMMWFYRRTMMLISELRQARLELAGLAVTEERLRFARDLHDLLGHSLSIISLKSQLARRLAEPDTPVAVEINDIESVARQALAEVREAVTGYRQRTLTEELSAMRGTLTAAGIEVSLSVQGPPLATELDQLLAWVVREGGTNVLRHSRASGCVFRLRRTGDATVCLDIEDNGVGALPDGERYGPGNGLAGLAERVTAAGGRLDCGPAPGRGFRLSARLPATVAG
jgi:two-component system sensor histidine kinase DesK